MFGDKITQSVSEAVKKVLATEKLHPNQQKLDVHEPEKDKLTKKDFEMLRSNKKPKNEAKDDVPFDGPYKSNFKKPNNPKRSGMDTARSLAQRAMDQVNKKKLTKEEVEEVEEASFYGNDKMAKAAQDSGDSKATVRMRDAKGTYTATMVRKQGEKDHKEISRVYDKKDVKEGWNDMMKAVNDRAKPQPSGGSGIKQGSRYGGGKQKDEPTQDEAPKTKKHKGMKNFKEMFGE